MPRTYVREPVETRFWAKVKKTDTCWLWTGAILDNGYGYFGVRHNRIGGSRGNNVLAHRFAYELLVGPIPAGLTLDHLCHNADKTCKGGWSCPHRRCIRPEHLEPVTRGENVLRGEGFAARNARLTHCGKGHPFDLFNTYIDIEKARHCRACRREDARRFRDHRKTAALNS